MNRPRRYEPLAYALATLLMALVAYFCGRFTGSVDMVAELVRAAPDPKTADQVRALTTIQFGWLMAMLCRVMMWVFLVPVMLAAVVYEVIRLRASR